MDVGQAEISALETIGQLGVVEAEQVQDRGVQVVHVNEVLYDVEAEIVGCPDGDAGFDTAAGQPHRKGVGMMIAAIIVVTLNHGSAAEFTAPHDERVVEHAALLEIFDLISAAQAWSVS